MVSPLAYWINHAISHSGKAYVVTSLLLSGFATTAYANGADTTATMASTSAVPSAAGAARAASVPAVKEATPSDSCTELGSAARAVAAWRDAGGAAWMAKAKLDQRIAEPTVRQAAQQLVDTLYTPTMRKLTPDETGLAVAQSCMAARTSSSVTSPGKAQ